MYTEEGSIEKRRDSTKGISAFAKLAKKRKPSWAA
jgi:hypothetical protein